MEKKLKPFDLQSAKAGAPVVTRDNRPVRIVCFDVKNEYPIIGIIDNAGKEKVNTYLENGRCYANRELPVDLFMAPVKREGWVNLYKSENDKFDAAVGNVFVYRNKEDAEFMAGVPDEDFIATAKIEWEE